MLPLSPARRSELRARAHALHPVVMIGDRGLTDSVVAEVDRALTAHELIKVKAATDDRAARVAWMAALCERLAAQPVQSIGKVLVLWRENPEEEAPAKAPAARRVPKKAAVKAPIRSARPRSPSPSLPRAPAPRRRRPRTSQ